MNEALAAWRQGDCVLGEQWFAILRSAHGPLATAPQTDAAESTELVEEQVIVLVVVTQTCDVVRSWRERPFIEVCPLVEVDESKLREIERGRRPAYGYLPLLAAQRIVADLDRTMTVEKPVVATWARTPGCATDPEARAFAAALARKRARFAFPDDFTDLARKLQNRLADKHEKNSDEGRALRALREIRVQAAPSWDANAVSLMFWFVRDERDADFEGRSWAVLLTEWLKLVPKSGRFGEIDGQVATLGEITAAEYVASDALDLDHLSRRE